MSESLKHYRALRDAVIDGRASAAEASELEVMILRDAELRTDFVEHAHLDAAIGWYAWEANATKTDPRKDSAPAPMDLRIDEVVTHRHPVLYYSALAAALAFFLLSGWLLFSKGSEPTYAKITSTGDCRWGTCSLPTTQGTPLSAGTLELVGGLVTIRFPNVSLTLEGQAKIEIVNSTSCRLHSGRVFADVEPGGEGFRIMTPTAEFIDLGTTFGVTVDSNGNADMTVVEGRVDVVHKASQEKTTARGFERVLVSTEGVTRRNSALAKRPSRERERREPEAGLVHLTTASGLGDDAYIAADPVRDEHYEPSMLLAKLPADSSPGQWYAPWRRKAFLRFDLSPSANKTIVSGDLQLQGVDTGIGYRSLVPDAWFAVYGLVDESQDMWDRDSLTWRDSPASDRNRLLVDAEQVVLIGKFEVKQSSPDGRFQVGGPELVDFINRDTNGVVTFILIPETAGQGGEAYVHGFASWRHPSLAAPTLRLRVQ